MRDYKRVNLLCSRYLALPVVILTWALILATPGFADTSSSYATINPSSRTSGPADVTTFLKELNKVNQRVATDETLDLVTANSLYRNLWSKANKRSITLSIPQKSKTTSSKRVAKFPTYAAILSVKHRKISYCVVADRFIASATTPAVAWSQSLLRGSCTKYFKVVII